MQSSQGKDDEEAPPPVPPRPPKPKPSEYEFLDAGEEFPDGEGAEESNLERTEPDYQNVKDVGVEKKSGMLGGKEEPVRVDPKA